MDASEHPTIFLDFATSPGERNSNLRTWVRWLVQNLWLPRRKSFNHVSPCGKLSLCKNGQGCPRWNSVFDTTVEYTPLIPENGVVRSILCYSLLWRSLRGLRWKLQRSMRRSRPPRSARRNGTNSKPARSNILHVYLYNIVA